MVRSLFAGAALAATLATVPLRATGPIPDLPSPAAGSSHDASLDDYSKHLQDLTTLVEACAKARDAKTCDPAQVGPDDQVPLTQAPNAERRPVRYGWLRVLLAKAQEKDKDAGKPESKPASKPASGEQSVESALPLPPTTTELLQAAETRLAEDRPRPTPHLQSPPTMRRSARP